MPSSFLLRAIASSCLKRMSMQRADASALLFGVCDPLLTCARSTTASALRPFCMPTSRSLLPAQCTFARRCDQCGHRQVACPPSKRRARQVAEGGGARLDLQAGRNVGEIPACALVSRAMRRQTLTYLLWQRQRWRTHTCAVRLRLCSFARRTRMRGQLEAGLGG